MKTGMINAHVCVNATTAQIHTEPGSIMTVISVTSQHDDRYLIMKIEFHFNVTKKLKHLLYKLSNT